MEHGNKQEHTVFGRTYQGTIGPKLQVRALIQSALSVLMHLDASPGGHP